MKGFKSKLDMNIDILKNFIAANFGFVGSFASVCFGFIDPNEINNDLSILGSFLGVCLAIANLYIKSDKIAETFNQKKNKFLKKKENE